MEIIIVVLILILIGITAYLVFKSREEQRKEPKPEKRIWRKEDKDSRDFFFPPKDD